MMVKPARHDSTSTPLFDVLLVEDDAGVADTVRAALAGRGLPVRHARSLAEAEALLKEGPYRLIILDLGLPDGSGLALAARLRRRGSKVPIIVLTANGRVDQRVAGFRHGADDYMCKPFAAEELLARTEAILRRCSAREPCRLRYDDLELDLLRRVARRPGIEVELSMRETDLLAFLMLRPEEDLERDRILAEVWGEDTEADSSVLNVYVNYLRNKLEGPAAPRIIHTVRGLGYRLSMDAPDEFR